ncbi:unnamed protein product [Sphenostylis stenocarpa]|uniref:Wall-associated receptor kinase C-terminal domain-containing protein n=1 Tax=Sphenostylis stenocarpa TaxID=92480 RepID=A0AA86W5Y5_9FABA|nr:unnamed protein product [Sphenostylis stenocarpa]
MNMKPFKEPQILHSLLLLNIIALGSSIPQQNHANYCGNIKTQTPFLNSNSSILDSITLCISQNLYLRTSLGLFHVSSLDYNGRLLTITHSSCSSLQYVSPLAVTTGFPSPEPNSLVLFNCSSRRDPILPIMQNCRDLYKCGGAVSPSFTTQDHQNHPHSCLVVEDLKKVYKGFHPEHLNCSHYSWVHRSTSDGGHDQGYKVGTRLSVDIPRVPEICQGCEKPNGSCGAGLNCLCHPKECKDKVISKAGIKSTGSVFSLCFLSLVLLLLPSPCVSKKV